MLTVSTILLLWLGAVRCEDVFMVIGGQFFNVTSREHDVLNTVEVISKEKSCQIGSMPTPLYGMKAVRYQNSVLVCGGYYYYFRSECYEYSPDGRRWTQSRISLPRPAVFPSLISVPGSGGSETLYLAGGRDYRQSRTSDNNWAYEEDLVKLQGSRWQKVTPLPEAVGDSCVVVTNHDGQDRLWIIGGSNYPNRFKSEVYTLNLNDPAANWTRMPDLLDGRMWHECLVTVVDGDLGILTIGGYYNGNSNLWLPLADSRGNSLEIYGTGRNQPTWRYASSLNSNRKWGPAIGMVGPSLAVAGAKDYGDATIEIFDSYGWNSQSFEMNNKREFATGVSVPSEWFPECGF